jgi:SAM-dependent methyltransferase
MSSYQAGAFEEPQAEVARLARQALVIAAEERAALSAVGLPTRGIGIEVGCGPGFFADGLIKASPGLRIVGLEIDPFVLRDTRTRLPVVRADARALPFADGSFDFTYSRLFLRHVPDPLGILMGIAKLVKPWGIVAAIDSSDVSLLLDPMPADFAAVAAARHAWFESRGGSADMGHRMPRLFAEAGLAKVRVRTVMVDTATIGHEAFAKIVLVPFLQAAERVLDDRERLAAATAAVQSWTEDANAYGVITLFVVAGTCV